MADEPNDEIDVEALQAQFAAFSVEQFLVSAASTIAQPGLREAGTEGLRGGAQGDRRPRARSSRSWRASCADDLALALTRLQLAYSDAVNLLGSSRSL